MRPTATTRPTRVRPIPRPIAKPSTASDAGASTRFISSINICISSKFLLCLASECDNDQTEGDPDAQTDDDTADELRVAGCVNDAQLFHQHGRLLFSNRRPGS